MAKSKAPEPSEFLVFPIVDLDLMVFFRGSDVTRPLYVSYKEFIKQLTKSITPASALLLQTNSVNNPTQTLLNLIQGSGITITDDGLGNITIDATGGGGAYTVDNGLTENPANNFQLGGTLIKNTTIDAGLFNLLVTGANTPGSVLSVINTATGVAGYFEALSGGTAVAATSSGKPSIVSIGVGVTPLLASNNVLGATDEPVAVFSRRIPSGSVSIGTGAYIDISLPRGSLGVLHPGSRIITRHTSVGANYNSTLEFWSQTTNFLTRKLQVLPTGQVVLDKYGIGTFSATPTYALGVDATGNVVEFTAGGGSVLTDNSIQGDGTLGNEIELVNDAATPGVNKVYGTDSSGTKGWKNDPVSPAGVIPGTVVGTFPKRRNSFGMETIPSADRLYVCGTTDSIVEIFEASSGIYLGFLSVTNAYGAIYCASRDEVWITSSASGTIRRYDPATFTYLGGDITGSGNGGLVYVEISPTKLYIANWSSNTITEIDPSTLTVVATITAAALGVTTIRSITYVDNISSLHNGYLAGTCVTQNEFYAIDTTTNAVVIPGTNFGGTLGSPPNAIAYNPVNDRYYVTTNTNVQVRIFEPNTTTTLLFENYIFSPIPQWIVCNPNTGKVYITCFGQNGSNVTQINIQCIGVNGIEWIVTTPSWNIESTFRSSYMIIDTTTFHVYAAGSITITGQLAISKVRI